VSKRSPEGSTCVYIFRKGLGDALEGRYLKTVSYGICLAERNGCRIYYYEIYIYQEENIVLLCAVLLVMSYTVSTLLCANKVAILYSVDLLCNIY
jgi:hypothetical protein